MNKNLRAFLFVLIILGILFSVYVYLKPSELSYTGMAINLPSIHSNEVKVERLNIEDFNRNKESYINKEVTVKGELSHYPFKTSEGCEDFYLLKDSDGYIIDFCPSIERQFTLGDTYTIKGVIVKEEYMDPLTKWQLRPRNLTFIYLKEA